MSKFYNVRYLKANFISMWFSIICSAAGTIFLLYLSNKFRSSEYYYWDPGVRGAASFTMGIGLILMAVAIIEFGMFLGLLILRLTGKVCPKCERIIPQSTVTCPKCNADTIYAERVKTYLSNHAKMKPTVKSIQPTQNNQNTQMKYCPNCGQKLNGNTKFCPNCKREL